VDVDCCSSSSNTDNNTVKTRKPTQPRGVENGASTRPPNLTSASCDLDLWPSDPWIWRFHALALWITCANL